MGRKPIEDKRLFIGLRLPTSLVTKLKHQEGLSNFTEFRKYVEKVMYEQLNK